ncbi:MAG: hypothetical protein O2894_03420 [Planctomycetota bacterium]|nr:hypothetical protein [Planctomycetota bacterium]
MARIEMLRIRWLPFLLFCLLGIAAPVHADEGDEDTKDEKSEDDEKAEDEKDAPKDGDGDTSPLEAVDDPKAKELAAELKKVSKKKNANDVLPALEAIEGLAHPEFEKTLLTLLKHESSIVAIKVAGMWEWRVTDKKVAGRLWKATWGEKKNERRYEVNALALKGFARASIALDERQFKEVEKAWRWIVGNPDEALAPALAALATWAGMAVEKRLFRRLAEELDEPAATNPNAPNNPPAEWWERRWKLWKESKPAVVTALKAITGQEFDKTEVAKTWCEANGKDAGVEW